MMTTPPKNPMTALYRRLKDVGIRPSYVQEVILPDWWEDSLALEPVAFAEAVGYVSQSLGVPPHELRKDQGDLPAPAPPAMFKIREGVELAAVSWPAALALRAARLAALAVTSEVLPVPEQAFAIREELLARGISHIDLPELLDYCWSLGIVVLHVSRLPTGKMDGMATLVDGRPVIVLSHQAKSFGRLLFILAHELGHIGRHHVENGAIVDGEIDEFTVDVQEKEATTYACELLTGEPSPSFPRPTTYRGSHVYPNVIIKKAREIGKQRHVSPSTVALHWAWRGIVAWPSIQAAIKRLEPSGANAPNVIREKMLAHLELDRLSDESRGFLCRVSDCE